MKAVYYFLILILFTKCSCKKEEAYVPNYDQGFTDVILNEENWKGEATFHLSNLNGMCSLLQTIALESKNAFGELRRSLVFSSISLEAEGRYNLVNINFNEKPCDLKVGFYLSVADGDAGDGEFWLDETQENYLEITHQDGQRIEGNYDLHFIVKDDNPPDAAVHSSFVNGARFENGYFEVFKQ